MGLMILMSKHQETVSFIWNVANLIRDTFKRGEYADVILPFTVLRRVDCVIRPTQEAVRKQYLELHGKIDNIDPLLRKTSGVAFYNTSKFNFDSNNSIGIGTSKNLDQNITNYYNLIYEYENDCLTAAIEYNKSYYTDGDLKPEENILFSIKIIPFAKVSSPSLTK